MQLHLNYLVESHHGHGQAVASAVSLLWMHRAGAEGRTVPRAQMAGCVAQATVNIWDQSRARHGTGAVGVASSVSVCLATHFWTVQLARCPL